jgi:hypothetical protein
MAATREKLGSIVGGTAAAAALAYFALTHEPAPVQLAEEGPALNIPTVEQMCAALGATEGGGLAECRALEASAGEYVIAWMGLNGFIADGTIDIASIQAIATLDETNAVDPSLTFDPTIDPSVAVSPALDPSFADPALSDPLLGGVTDPLTGDTTPVFASPAQLALFCLSGASDWLSLQDCISMNDRTITLDGVP